MNWADFHPIAQEAIKTTLWVGVLTLLVLIVRRPFARRFGAKAAYMLWALPLIRFMTPPLPENWSLSGRLGLGQSSQQPMTLSGPSTSSPLEVVFQDPVLQVESGAAVAAEGPVMQVAADAQDIAVSYVPSSSHLETPIVPTSSLSEPLSAPPLSQGFGTGLPEAILAQTPLILTLVWIAGMVLWLTKSAWQQHQFLDLIEADSESASPEIIEETAKIARQLGLRKVPDVRVSLLCAGPLVTGLRRPVVLLPMWFEADYTPAERRDALIHELMHLKRRDLWAFQIARIIAATQWFNPLVHKALQAFRTDQEAACDADVLARARLSPAAYGRTLVKAARLARPSDRRIAAASLTLAHPIKERLIMMTHPKPSLKARLLGGGLVLAFGSAAVFATASTASVAQELKGGTDERAGDIAIDQRDDSLKITVNGKTLDFTGMDLPPMPPMPAMPPVPGMHFEQDGQHFHMSFNTEDWESFETSPEFADWETRMEAWGEEMEAWGEQVEANADAWGEEIEPYVEAWAEAYADQIEANVEAWTSKIELMADQMETRAERDAVRAERDRERAERQAERAVERAERDAERARARAASKAEKYQNGDGAKMISAPETRDFGSVPFNRIEVGSGMSVIYTQDPKPSVTAKLERGSWDHVDIRVVDGVLKVSKKNKSAWYGPNGPKLTVYAASSDLKSVDASSGAAFSGTRVGGDLDIDASSGSSLTLEGACAGLSVDASSGSSVSLSKLECKSASVDASSGSSVQVYASNAVSIDASSGSSVTARGNPKSVTKDASSGASVSVR